MQATEKYKLKNHVRVVTAASLFDGHDAAINVIRRILQGTGAEDYFNGAYYFAGGTCSLPWHGVTVKDWQERGRISAYRFHMTDYVPFSSSLRMVIEGGGDGEDAEVSYSSVAFWYQL